MKKNLRMAHVCADIERASAELCVPARALNEPEFTRILSCILETFRFDRKAQSFPMQARRQDSAGWIAIMQLFDGPLYLVPYTFGDRCWAIYEMANGEDLCRLLEETFGFELLVCPKDLSCLVELDHHDILLATGEPAASFVSSLP